MLELQSRCAVWTKPGRNEVQVLYWGQHLRSAAVTSYLYERLGQKKYRWVQVHRSKGRGRGKRIKWVKRYK